MGGAERLPPFLCLPTLVRWWCVICQRCILWCVSGVQYGMSVVRSTSAVCDTMHQREPVTISDPPPTEVHL